ncbi:putative flavin-binding monooxygenase protein [Neofusicoccum parvum UCRNP2]|uniref:Putative flavin-binding monooxygenase protein n=1 Tax=Botryosphaeria parva (strain UCR-NP2) TaxID=1287680 RepID=R1GYK5_BOTPV|nr:putative flavin-binding monooxygenase protein [Neofusicoccum parvum UCRNP2]
MQKHVKHMDVFARTPNWFVEIAGHHGNNRRYDPSERERFRKNPEELLRHIKETELMYNAHWDNAIMGTELQKEVIEKTAKRMKDIVKDDTLLKVSCRRITPGDPYLHAIQEPNVNMHFTGAARIEKDGVVGEDGTVVTCDTIVCATGFDTTWKPRFPVVGRNGVDLREKWRDSPAAYFGVACPDMPNWITFLGPNCWYKDLDTGRVTAVYCGHSLHYRDMLSSVRWEDMDIRYTNVREGSDISPYFGLQRIDKRWRFAKE